MVCNTIALRATTPDTCDARAFTELLPPAWAAGVGEDEMAGVGVFGLTSSAAGVFGTGRGFDAAGFGDAAGVCTAGAGCAALAVGGTGCGRAGGGRSGAGLAPTEGASRPRSFALAVANSSWVRRPSCFILARRSISSVSERAAGCCPATGARARG